MPNNGEVSNYTGVFRLASPSDSSSHRRVIKRNRQVVSCVPCRNRKLKCDRQQPCASCVRRHDVEACQFLVGPRRGGGGSAVVGGSPGLVDSAVPKREMRTKLAMLEDLVQGLVEQGREHDGVVVREAEGEGVASRSVAAPAASSPASQPAAAQTPVGGEHLSRDGNGVRFVGATNYQAILECVRDLQGFVDATEHAPPPVTAAPSRQHGQGQSAYGEQLPGREKTFTIQEVMRRLPSRADCDGLLTFYFQQIHMIPTIIHTGGQFQRAYERFWQNPEDTSLLWISLLFSLLSTSLFQQASHSVGSGDGTHTLSPEVRDKITGFSSMAYQCLLAGNHLTGKLYSVEATLIYGMHLILQKRDTEPECWHTIETAVRIAQRMGYHRDAQNLSRNNRESGMSPFEAEMRRRTWVYLEYFDVTYSFQHGVPPIIRSEDVDTKLPSNLRDEEFDEDSRVLPQSRPTVDYTPVLPFIYLARLNKLLRDVIQQALAVRPPSYGDVRILDAELGTLCADIPPSLRYRPVRESGFADAPDLIMRRFLCEISYLKTMCILHRRYLTLEDAMYEQSRSACREAALRMLALQAEFDEHSGEGGRLYEKRYMFTNPAGHHDFLLAAMCVCLDLIACSKKDNPKEQKRKMQALSKARTIWSKTAYRSKEAAHATKVLDEILAQVSQPAASGPSARAVVGESSAASAAGTAAASSSRRDNAHSAEPVRDSEGPLPQPNWSAVNSNLPSEKAPSKSYSLEWSYAWLDNLGKQKEHAPNGALGTLLTNGVDWNHIDSLLLDREHTAGGTSLPSSNANSSLSVSREGWPYMSYKEPETNEGPRPASFRTWGRPLTGIMPSFDGGSPSATF